MTPISAMAGMAEAYEALALFIGYSGLLLVFLASAIGLFGGFRQAAGVAVFLAAAVTFLFMPWEAFRSAVSDDPDVEHRAAAARGFAYCWCAGLVFSLAAVVRALAFPAAPRIAVRPSADSE